MRNEIIYPEILSMILIPQVTEDLKEALFLTEKHKSCAIMTATMDDLIFLTMDEATKKADVDVTYIGSFYGGGANASSKLQGEGIGIIAGETVSSVQAGIDAIYELYDSKQIYAVSCNEDNSICSLVYTVASVGSYFAKELNIPLGISMAYLAGPPVESVYATDAADKASGAKLVKYFTPPTVTNTGGAMFIGTQAECAAACEVFAEAIQEIADNHMYGR